MTPSNPIHRRRSASGRPVLAFTAVAAALASIGVLSAVSAFAATTDIAAEPVITRSNVSAKPNLMFVLDDSGSMGWSYMPDELGDNNNDPRYGKYGYWSPQCNGLAYDPSTTYTLPVRSDNTAYPSVGYTAARDDGYVTSAGTIDLSGSYYYNYTGAQTKMGWTYNATTGSVDSTTTFYSECMSDIGNTPGSSRFTRVSMDSATTAQKTNYAIWRTYYARRYMLMRTAVGQAVQALDAGYRVGFSRINSTSYTDGSNFRDVKPFDATQKSNFYSSLYGASPGGGTPLRGALSKIGRYYAKKLPNQSYDPVEYSCQRNFAILTTDGYWNKGGSPGPAEDDSTYGALDLSGAMVGNQDASEVRPMYDGGTSTTRDVTPTVTTTRTSTVSRTQSVVTSSRTQTTLGGSCGLFNLGTRVTTTPQTMTTTTIGATTVVTDSTVTSTRTVVTTNGTVTSDNAVSATTSNQVSSNTAVESTSSTNWVSGTGSTVCSYSPPAAGTSTATNSSPVVSNLSTPVTTTVSVIGPTVGVTVTTTTSTGGSSNTLSDVAQYYWKTDLRTAALGNCASRDALNNVTDVCSNIVPTSTADSNSAQHMNTYTIGLGVNGTLAYSGDLANLRNGSKNWPATTTTISGSSGDARNIDDLWHAAVNGRGQYYSALTASGLSQAISGVVSSIQGVTGSGAAASFNTLAFVSGSGNTIYQAGYTTSEWSGELKAFSVNGDTGAVSSTPLWSAQTLLNARTAASRTIYYRQSAASSTMRAFNYTNLSADSLASNFTNLCSKSVVPTQCSGLSTAQATTANDATNLINFLRGDRTNETTIYRKRNWVLGDIINGAPVFVGKPPFSYSDAGYASHASTYASRKQVVYVGGNDGMLHAFAAGTGEELWAYVPTSVMSKMYRLADQGYDTSHEYFVDGQPVVADINVGGTWKTILIGGLNLGGRSYYALDVTDPDNPRSLWEFTDTNMGFTFGNPVVTKRADGTWIVALTSGYNNTSGDGRGHLYILNANTGALLHDISTGVGTTASPAGLAKITAWVDVSTDNTAKRFYGGDVLGNLWRFDIDNLVQPYRSALLLAQLQTPGGAVQPVTTKPQAVMISGAYPVIVVGTGRYMGMSDINDSSVQTIYAIKDSLTNSGVGVARNNTNMVRHTVSVTDQTSIVSSEPITWSQNAGWWFDLPLTGERMVTDMAVSAGLLTAASAIPSGNACESGGSSWLYRVNLTTGAAPANTAFGIQFSPSAIVVGLTAATLSDGTSVVYGKLSTGKQEVLNTGVAQPPDTGDAQRTSWRELIKE